MPSISVIIPAYNDAARLERTLRRLRQLRERECPGLEIIVSARSSRDRTEEVARELADTVVEGGTPSRARNNGARAARGELLVFLDADALPAPGTFTALARAARPRVIGSCTAYTEETSLLAALTVRSINFLRWAGLIKGLSNLLFCHRSLFHEHGVFYDENLSLGEHHDFVRRAGGRGWTFTYVRTRPGYVLNMDRHKQWGYLPLCLFWMKWSLLHGLLRLDARHLEREYWRRSAREYAPQSGHSPCG